MKDKLRKPYICFFPTQTLFVDDSKDFLDGLVLKLPYNLQSYSFCNSANDALSIIEANKKEYEWFKLSIKNFEEEEYEHKIVEFNIADIYKRIFYSNRFNIISSVIVDYDMPGKNGLELCKDIQDSGLHKVLLTGVADEQTAIDAFNNNLIDEYIPKHKSNVYELIEASITRGMHSYFSRLSELMLTSIEKDKDSEILFHKSFLTLFNQILKENKIIEFYIVRSTGSFILITEYGRIDLLFCIPENYIDSMYDELKEEKISYEVLKSLRNKKKIVCLFDLDSKPLSIKDYDKLLEKATEISIDSKKYYFAYRKDLDFTGSENLSIYPNLYRKHS